jgi:hypothetical protein
LTLESAYVYKGMKIKRTIREDEEKIGVRKPKNKEAGKSV